MSFKGQAVMITGAAGNLGQAVAAAFAAAGANLALLDLNEDCARQGAGGAPATCRASGSTSRTTSISAAVGAAMARSAGSTHPPRRRRFPHGQKAHEIPADKRYFMMELNPARSRAWRTRWCSNAEGRRRKIVNRRLFRRRGKRRWAPMSPRRVLSTA